MFGKSVDDEILGRAIESTQEICGVIVDGKPVFLENESDDPDNHFLVKKYPDNIQGVFHSHPDGPFYPSLYDMRQQYAMVIPWGIAAHSKKDSGIFWWGEDVPKLPLIGRPFRHGVTDCYSLIQDFYKEVHDKNLTPVPRDWEWWDGAESLYTDNFERAGFYTVDSSDIKPGDVFFATIRSKVPNHAGVYLGNGLILHHTAGRSGYDPTKLSTVEPGARWFNYLSRVVRHEDDNLERKIGQGIWPRV